MKGSAVRIRASALEKALQEGRLSQFGDPVVAVERHYGALLDGAHGVIASRLDAFEAELEKAVEK